MEIYLYRKEFDKAIRFFEGSNQQYTYFVSSSVHKAAEKLETLYPEVILAYYKAKVGNLNIASSRKDYARNANVLFRVRRVLVSVMKKDDEWKTLARNIKSANARRPAFQQEFASVIPGWLEL